VSAKVVLVRDYFYTDEARDYRALAEQATKWRARARERGLTPTECRDALRIAENFALRARAMKMGHAA
jgi:hypothetical protein